MSYRSWIIAGILCGSSGTLLAQQTAPAASVTCRVEAPAQALSPALSETSGLALSSQPGVLWTHNDGSEPTLFALSPAASIIGKVRVTGLRLNDWEDLTAGTCAAGYCLYLADIGDNSSNRPEIAIHEIAEPRIEAGSTAALNTYRMRYPDGPRDAEAVFRTTNGDLYIVSKGRSGKAVNLYRYPAPYRAHELVVLELVGQVAPRPQNEGLVTGAAITPDNAWVVIRSYSELRFYPAASLLRGDPDGAISMDVSAIKHRQSEAVAIAADGTVWLTSEAESKSAAPSIVQLRCNRR